MVHQWLGAVVTGAYLHSEFVEQEADVVGMVVAEQERDYSLLAGSLPEDTDGRYLFEKAVGGVPEQVLLVGVDSVEPNPLDEVDGTAEGGDVDEVRGAGFKLEGELGVGGAVERDVAYHLAATLVGGHLLEHLAAAVEHTDAAGAIHLVGREGIEIAAEFLDIDMEMRRGLGAVDEHRDVVGMRYLSHLADGVDGAQHVADVAERGHHGAFVEGGFIALDVEHTTLVNLHHPDSQTLLILNELPGHDVGMVLHDGEDYLVAVAEGLAEACRHEVDGLSGAAGEDYLGGLAGVDIAAYLLAGLLLMVGGLLGEGVDPAVNVGLRRAVQVCYLVDHTVRGLRGGGVVEVYHPVSRHLAAKDRELSPDLL